MSIKKQSFPESVLSNLRTKCRCSLSDSLIIGVSGGADSVALLCALAHSKVNIIAAHCNYGLRGEESDGDENYVRRLCSDLGVELYIERPNVREYMKSHGVSLEMACRDLRYAFFNKLMKQRGANAVAVAHHREDNVETFFLNALRGTGLIGLRGMKWRREPAIVRPMLDLSRSDIENYLIAKGLTWRMDSSNAVSDVKRNRLRNLIFPVIEQSFPDATLRIEDTMTHIGDAADLYASFLTRLRSTFESIDGKINIDALVSEFPVHASLILYEWLRGEGLTKSMAQDIVANPSRAGAEFGNWQLERGILYKSSAIESISPRKLDNLYNGPWEYTTIHPDDFAPSRNPYIVYFDASILNGVECWELRTWRKGDRIRPFGLKGTRLVSDVFSDCHFSKYKKLTQPLLVRNKEIVWIPGVMASGAFPVSPNSASIIRLSYNSDALNSE